MREVGNRIGEVSTQRALDSLADTLDRRLRTDRTSATYHEVTIAAGSEATIAHRKGHAVRWVIVRARSSPAQVYEQTNNENVLVLHHAGALTTTVEVMLW